MNNLWNKINENKAKSIIIGLVVVLIIILGLFFRNSTLSFGDLSFWGNQSANITESDLVKDLLDEMGNESITESESINSKDSDSNSDNQVAIFPVVEIVDGLAYFNRVKVPVLANPNLFDYEGQITAGCENEIVWVMLDIEPTRAPLSGSISKLLNYEHNFGFEPGNFLATQSELLLNEVVIENGIAKIYLEGEFTIEEECDLAKVFIQLEEVALQYSTVNGVQIYLNTELIR